jgi:hypothetical protein
MWVNSGIGTLATFIWQEIDLPVQQWLSSVKPMWVIACPRSSASGTCQAGIPTIEAGFLGSNKHHLQIVPATAPLPCLQRFFKYGPGESVLVANKEFSPNRV